MSLAPCDIFAVAGTPCVAAHSLVRALYANYTGSLYQVQRLSDDYTADIDITLAGLADSQLQDRFCAQSSCTIKRIFDQSPRANHLDVAPAGGNVPHGDKPVVADRHSISIGGQPVYGAYFEGGMGYRNDSTSGMATGDAPETIYMVTSGKHYNDGCCFDYGNAELDNLDDGKATVEALYFGLGTHDWAKGSGDGPWVMADLEKGLYAGDAKGPWKQPSFTHEFVSAMLKGKAGQYGLKGGNAQAGSLQTLHEGERPAGYEKMKKKGAIILGIGGDNSNRAIGTFYEGAIVAGYTSDAADNALQENIVAAKYGKMPAPSPTPVPYVQHSGEFCAGYTDAFHLGNESADECREICDAEPSCRCYDVTARRSRTTAGCRATHIATVKTSKRGYTAYVKSSAVLV